jgi:hypothetical protein
LGETAALLCRLEAHSTPRFALLPRSRPLVWLASPVRLGWGLRRERGWGPPAGLGIRNVLAVRGDQRRGSVPLKLHVGNDLVGWMDQVHRASSDQRRRVGAQDDAFIEAEIHWVPLPRAVPAPGFGKGRVAAGRFVSRRGGVRASGRGPAGNGGMETGGGAAVRYGAERYAGEGKELRRYGEAKERLNGSYGHLEGGVNRCYSNFNSFSN